MSNTDELDPKAGPIQVRTRKGSRGPGSVVATIVTQEDADKVAKTLEAEVSDGVMIFTRPVKVTAPITFGQWTEAREEEVKAAEAEASARAKLNADDIKALKLDK